jgi:hypothetical protein
MRITRTPTCRPPVCIGTDRAVTIALLQSYGRTEARNAARAAFRARWFGWLTKKAR